LGQYWATVRVPLCNYVGGFTFDVLEPGEIKDDGDFVRIEAPSWANTGDIVPIKAIFRNRGVRGVRAVFKGTVKDASTEEIVKVINTDEYVVSPDQTTELETFFNPLFPGQYVVSGKIYYNNKLSVERSTLINVNGSPTMSTSSTVKIVIIFIVVVAILVLLILIKRKKRKPSPFR